MKKSRRILCLLLAGSMLLLTAACGVSGKEDQSTQAGEGRYVETDITPPISGRFTSFLAADGTIVCFDEGLKNRYESADGGGSWSQAPGPGSGGDRYKDVQTATLLPDGGLLVYIQGEGLVIIAPDGSGAPYPVTDIDEAIARGDGVMISLLQALENDRLLLGFTIGGMVIQSREGGEGGIFGATAPDTASNGGEGPMTDSGPQMSSGTFSSAGPMSGKTLLLELSTGQTVAQLPAESAISAVSDGESLYLLDAAGKVTAYSLSDGTPADREEISFGGGQTGGASFISAMSGMGGGVLALDGKGGLYAAQNGSLLMSDASGSVKTLLESAAYSIGAPRSAVNSVHVLADGGIVVNLLDNGQDGRLYKYVWDENAKADPNKTLTVWSLEDNSFVRAAIAQLRKKHPDSLITYEIAMDGDSAVSAADAIKTLNTRLLNGSGPDVILLDGCPVESYADKEMLLDLGGLLDTGDVYENLLAPYLRDGKLYCLPTQFLMPALMGKGDALAKVNTLDDLVALVVNGNDLPADNGPSAPGGSPFASLPEEERAELYFSDLKELCKLLWLASAPAIVSDNRLDTEALRSYLEAAKAISDKYGLGQTNQGGGGFGLSVSVFDGGAATVMPGSLTRYTMEITNYGAFAADNLQLMQLVMDREGSELALFPGLTTGAWEPSAVAGVSADTKVSEFAAELVQAMLSLEVQKLSYGTGLPVTRTGLAEQIDGINQRLAESDRGAFDLDVDALIARLQTPSMGDAALTEMMWSTVEKCCKGELDVEGAVKEIEQNVKNYLAERE